MPRGRATQTKSESENPTVSDENPAIQEAPEGTEATDETTEPDTIHVFQVGDEARVVRGKLRGRNGKIIAYNAEGKTYAITLDGDGTLAVVNAGNLKAPQDTTISVRALVSVLVTFHATEPDTTYRLAAALDAVAPEVSVKLSEALAAS